MAVGAGAVSIAAQGAAPKRPNILVLHTDEQRIECLGAYGNREIQTPHLDRLAADGVRYDNSFCPFPVCTPSRYSLISGLYVHEHRGCNNHCTLAPEIETFPRILRAAGYHTAAVGKMHFTPTYLDVGFDEMYLSEQDGPGRWDDDYHRYLMQRGLVDGLDIQDQRKEYRDHAPQTYWDTFGAQVSDLPEEHHSTTWIGDRAMEILKRWDASGGHLLMAGFVKPHHPFDPPAPWHERYDPARLSLLPGWTERCLPRDGGRGYFDFTGLTEAAYRKVLAYYYATISQIDFQVGRMLDLLRARGLYDDTLILFTSDHGDYMGYHHLLLKGNHMYDATAKVPLIVKWPGNKSAGTASKQMVSNIDLAPTICRAAGVRAGARMSGKALQVEGAGHEIVFAEQGAQVMARTPSHKLLMDGRRRLFFDLEKDPHELQDRSDAPEYRDEIQRLEEALAAWRPGGPPTPFLDEKAPTIRRPNVPPRDLSHRPAIIQYYAEKMGVKG